MVKIPKAIAIEVLDRWAFAKGRPTLPVLDKPCHDCAVKEGMYLPHADSLAKESLRVQEQVLSGWFCHNHPNRACRGARDHVEDCNRTNSGALPKNTHTDNI